MFTYIILCGNGKSSVYNTFDRDICEPEKVVLAVCSFLFSAHNERKTRNKETKSYKIHLGWIGIIMVIIINPRNEKAGNPYGNLAPDGSGCGRL